VRYLTAPKNTKLLITPTVSRSKLVKNAKQILAVSIGGLGDSILFSPVLKALKNCCPEAKIHMLLGSELAGLAYNNCQEVDKVSVIRTKGLSLLPKIIKFCCFGVRSRFQGGYDIAVLATGLNQNLSRLLKTTAGIPCIFKAPSFPDYETDFLCNIKLAHFFDENIKPDDVFVPFDLNAKKEAFETIRKNGLSLNGGRYIAVYPSSDLPHRPRWQPTRLLKVVNLIQSQGFTGKILVVGSLEEGQEWSRLDLEGAADMNLAGQLSIPAIAALLSKASLTIGNDGGILHIAGAVGCPLVAIMPNTPHSYRPVGTRTKVIRSKHTCCEGLYPKRPNSCAAAKCTDDISVEEVVKACKDLI
jgi:ADP-heptose:LPS heptosyltransferase